MIAQNAPSRPLVSVVMPVYNAGGYLRPAVESVLRQTYPHWELLVIDDGSTDGCLSTIGDITDPRIRRISQTNQGKSVAMNLALAEMRGEFYAIQDADDLADPARIERQLAALQARPALAACFCGHALLIHDRVMAPRMRHKGPDECRADIERIRMPAHDPTGMYRLELVRDLQYEPALRVGQGYDYILRVGERHPMMVLGECLYYYRVHPNSVTRKDYQRRQKFITQVVDRACRRRGLDPEGYLPPWVRPDYRPRNSDLDNNLGAHFLESALDLRRAGRRWEALRTGLTSIGMHPLDLHYYKASIYALAPLRWVDAWRAMRVSEPAQPRPVS